MRGLAEPAPRSPKAVGLPRPGRHGFADPVTAPGPAVLLPGRFVPCIRADDPLGTRAGDPAFLSGANRMRGSDRPDLGHAMVPDHGPELDDRPA